MINLLYGNVPRRRPRTYRFCECPLLNNFTDAEIRNRFRFTRDTIFYQKHLVHDDLVRRRNHALSVTTQVLIALRVILAFCNLSSFLLPMKRKP